MTSALARDWMFQVFIIFSALSEMWANSAQSSPIHHTLPLPIIGKYRAGHRLSWLRCFAVYIISSLECWKVSPIKPNFRKYLLSLRFSNQNSVYNLYFLHEKGAASSPETLVSIYHTNWRHTIEHRQLISLDFSCCFQVLSISFWQC